MGRDNFVAPKTLFADCTYLGHDPEAKRQITRQCLSEGYIPIIEYSQELGWVFHSLQYPRHDMVWKKDIAAQFEAKKQEQGRYLSESEIEKSLSGILTKVGIPHKCQVSCAVGRIDVVTARSIIEIKQVLDRDTLFHAIGQVLAYQTTFDQSRRTVILALRIDDAAADVARYCYLLGISIVIWDGISPVVASEL